MNPIEAYIAGAQMAYQDVADLLEKMQLKAPIPSLAILAKEMRKSVMLKKIEVAIQAELFLKHLDGDPN